MKFLIDEDVPVTLLKTLVKAGHDAVRVTPSSSDPTIAETARREGRILVTLDNDFTNKSLYPPERFTIVHIQLHPPYESDVVRAFMALLEARTPEWFTGLILLGPSGSLRILE